MANDSGNLYYFSEDPVTRILASSGRRRRIVRVNDHCFLIWNFNDNLFFNCLLHLVAVSQSTPLSALHIGLSGAISIRLFFRRDKKKSGVHEHWQCIADKNNISFRRSRSPYQILPQLSQTLLLREHECAAVPIFNMLRP